MTRLVVAHYVMSDEAAEDRCNYGTGTDTKTSRRYLRQLVVLDTRTCFEAPWSSQGPEVNKVTSSEPPVP